MGRPRPKVSITVLRTRTDRELLDTYAIDLSPTCPVHREGQKYMSRDLEMPEGFCDWAWADIQRDVAVICSGGDYPWSRKKGAAVACCTDAFRTVVFLIERVEEAEDNLE